MHENFKRTGEEKEEKETFTLIPHVYRYYRYYRLQATGIHVKIKNVGQFDIDTCNVCMCIDTYKYTFKYFLLLFLAQEA
jgi:hypothetical protein